MPLLVSLPAESSGSYSRSTFVSSKQQWNLFNSARQQPKQIAFLLYTLEAESLLMFGVSSVAHQLLAAYSSETWPRCQQRVLVHDHRFLKNDTLGLSLCRAQGHRLSTSSLTSLLPYLLGLCIALCKQIPGRVRRTALP